MLSNGSYATVLYNEDNTYSVVNVLPTLISFDLPSEELPEDPAPEQPVLPPEPTEPVLPPVVEPAPEVEKKVDEVLAPKLPTEPVVTDEANKAPDATVEAKTTATKKTAKNK